jgi:hypothetical protein
VRLDCEASYRPVLFFGVRLPIKAKRSIAKTNVEAMDMLSLADPNSAYQIGG